MSAPSVTAPPGSALSTLDAATCGERGCDSDAPPCRECAAPSSSGAVAALVIAPARISAGGQEWLPCDEASTPIGYELALHLGEHGRPAGSAA